ncbi:MAG: hypothetical protein ABSE16_02070 [Verrucomicrobiota bacterium]|jgi:hypothetical protein
MDVRAIGVKRRLLEFQRFSRLQHLQIVLPGGLGNVRLENLETGFARNLVQRHTGQILATAVGTW